MAYIRTRTFIDYSPPAVSAAVANEWESAHQDASTRLTNVESTAVRKDSLVYNVKDYGATGDGVADDTAAIQAAVTAAPWGSTVLLPTGAYRVTAPITISKRLKLIGSGSGSSDHCRTASSRIEVASPVDNGITVSEHGVLLEDFAVVNTADTPAAGAGIQFTAARYSRVNRVAVVGFYDNLVFEQGLYYQVSKCWIFDPIRYGIRIRNTDAAGFDTGDQLIEGCTIAVAYTTRNPVSAIRWESGGGPRIIGCKVNGSLQYTGQFANGVDAAVADGTTVDMVINGCSIENVTAAGIKVSQQGTTGSFARIMITGNEIGSGSIPDAIQVTANTAGNIADITITGNVVAIASRSGVWLEKISRAQVTGNIFRGSFTQAGIYISGCDGVDVGPNIIEGSAPIAAVFFGTLYSTRCTVVPQNIQMAGQNIVLIQNNSENSVAHASLGLIEYDVSRELPNVTTSGSYTKLYRLVPSSSGMGGILDFSITGLAAGGDAFTIVGRRAVTRPRAAGSAVVVSTIGADVTLGTAVDYQIDVGTAGELAVSVKLNAASGATDLSGRCNVKYQGSLFRLIRA